MTDLGRRLDREATALWFFAFYGATMVSVQLLEHTVAFLYAVVNTDPNRYLLEQVAFTGQGRAAYLMSAAGELLEARLSGWR